jgi:hypothetical protein
MLVNVATHCYIEQVDLGPAIAFSMTLLVVLLIAASFASGPVSRARLERFARRQRLEVTVDNGDQVFRYLATTRRWRVAGLASGMVGTSVFAATHPEGGGPRSVLTLFVGWFLGALVAEIRVAHLAHGSPRVASLRPRRPTGYLGRSTWALVPAAAVLATVVAAGTLWARSAGTAAADWTAGLWYGLALAVTVAVRVTQLTVLRRPQPLAAPDLLAADDAIRSRSLHVLAGGGTALVLLCAGGQLNAMHATGGLLDVVRGVTGLGVFVVLILAWNVATSVWPPRRATPAIP